MAQDERSISMPVLGGGGLTSIGPALSGLLTPGAEARPPVRSLYLHVPFCFHKCHYCDFYSIVDEHDRQEEFVARLALELRSIAPLAKGAPLLTIFVGGGTPSLLRVPLWERLLRELGACFDLSLIRAGTDPRTEFTVECNPETVTPELAGTLRAGGVDRISMGAQSFNPAHLKTLERRHDPESVGRSVEIVRAAGFSRVSMDLIFAIPGQSLEEWRDDLRRALAFKTTHLSCYNLTYEPNTAMTARLKRGEFEPLEEVLEAAMYHETGATLAAAGLQRYEVSNYAQPGQESRHNLVYWRNQDWLAAGPGASGHVQGWRWKNAPNLREYLASGEGVGRASRTDGFPPAIDIESPDRARALRERIMMGIRINEGLDTSELVGEARRLGASAGDGLEHAATELINGGLLQSEAGRWKLTPEGFLCADHVAAELMGALG